MNPAIKDPWNAMLTLCVPLTILAALVCSLIVALSYEGADKATLIGVIITAAIALIGTLRSSLNATAIQEVHKLANSNLATAVARLEQANVNIGELKETVGSLSGVLQRGSEPPQAQ